MSLPFFSLVLSCQSMIEQPQQQKPQNRLLAIGDLHADLTATKEVLVLAGIIDNNDQWIAKNTILVQTGDLTDRGPDGDKILHFMKQLEEEAPKHNAQFITLIGNHESMNIMGDWRYVSKEDVTDFGGLEKRKAAFSQNGAWRNWFLTHDAVKKVGNTVFVHGGVSEEYAKLGIENINKQVREGLSNRSKTEILSSDGPLWYRGYLLNEEASACAELSRTLKLLDAKRMVVGHTTQRNGKIAHRCDGALIGIDTGISTHYGKSLSVLDLTADDARAIYIGKNIDIPDPS